jgi:hypothetical protein
MLEPANDHSFLRLYPAGGEVSLPVIPLREPLNISPAIILCPGEEYSFYMTTEAGGLSIVDGSGGSVGVGLSYTMITTTIGTHTIIGMNYNGGARDGVYQVMFGGNKGSFVEVINDIEDARQVSGLFEFNHNKIMGKFYYPYAPTGYMQKMRLRCTVSNIQPKVDITSYRSSATGKYRNLQGVYAKTVTIETVDYTRHDHDAAAILSLHDHIFINDREYVRDPENSYRANLVSDVMGSNGTFGLIDNDATFLFKC